MICAIKLISFHILLSCRWLVLAVSKFFALAFLSVFIMSLTIDKLSDIPLSMKFLIAICGVTFTSIFWFYDYLIFCLKPKMIDIMLVK
jgi:hypothetical protein